MGDPRPDVFQLKLPAEVIESRIYLFRGQRVLMDVDVAELYGIEVKRLIQTVKNHHDRFPRDFVFQLSREEFNALKAEADAPEALKSRKAPPYVFTEAGVSMLAFFLETSRATRTSVEIMRAFIQYRQLCLSKDQLISQEQLEEVLQHFNKVLQQLDEKHDEQMQAIMQVLRRLGPQDLFPRRSVGFMMDPPIATPKIDHDPRLD